MASTRVIGLDIGTGAVRAAELEFGSGGPSGKNPPTLQRYGEVPLPLGAVRDGEVAEQAIVAGALKELWSRAKFSTKDVVIGVGNQRVLVRETELPWMPREQLTASLAYHVGDLLPMATNDALLDYCPTAEVDGPTGRMVHGLLVAAQRDTVNANVLAVEGAGLRPVMVDLNAFALVRALARGDYASRTVALVDIGAQVTTVVVAAHGRPQLVRMLPVGGHQVTTAVASALGVAVVEAESIKREIGVGYAVGPDRAQAAENIAEVVRQLVESIRNTFVYYAGAHPGAGVELVVLTGGGAHLPGLGQYLSSASRIAVTLGDPLGGLRAAKSAGRDRLAGRESLIALPVGLAYGAAA